MPSSLTRRPVPALVALAALLLLTGLVWWRVLNRGTSGATAAHCPTPSPSTSAPVTATLPAPTSINLTVLNSTNRTGIAGKARAALVADGFKVPAAAGNDTAFHNKIPGVAEIRYGPAAKQAASVVLYYVPGAKLVPNASKTSTVVVSLGAKYRSIATPAAAAAAMKAAGVRTSAPPSSPAPGTASPSC
ncbi:MAG TPA: LytR C-terminal domain-containing protein [Jatrophihabitans sp.]|nr:LytR C-terminal domain-containing protein [Jatrophihabitans sp.]